MENLFWLTEEEKALKTTDLYLRGRAFSREGQTEYAILTFQECMSRFMEEGNDEGYLKSLNSLGVTYSSTGVEDMAIDCYLKGLSYAYDHNAKGVTNLFYNNMGSSFYDLGAYEDALHYYTLALYDMQQYGLDRFEDQSWVTAAYMNMGMVNYFMGENEKAEAYLDAARNLENEINDDSYSFGLAVISAQNYLTMGKKKEAEDLVPVIIDMLPKHRETVSDYVEDAKQAVDLFRKMGRHDLMWTIIQDFDGVADEVGAPRYFVDLAELYMLYYKEVGDEGGFNSACVEHAEYTRRFKELSMDEKIRTLDLKFRLQDAEDSINIAQKKAYQDELSGLWNRTGLDKFGPRFVRDQLDVNGSLLVGMVDVDQFKQYNDTYGHLEGDNVIVEISKIIANTVDGYGVGYRYGGDEFLIIVPAGTGKIAKVIADKIQRGIRELAIPSENSNVAKTVTLSQGYYVAKVNEGSDILDFIKASDDVLYEVKAQGKNNFIIRNDEGL